MLIVSSFVFRATSGQLVQDIATNPHPALFWLQNMGCLFAYVPSRRLSNDGNSSCQRRGISTYRDDAVETEACVYFVFPRACSVGGSNFRVNASYSTRLQSKYLNIHAPSQSAPRLALPVC